MAGVPGPALDSAASTGAPANSRRPITTECIISSAGCWQGRESGSMKKCAMVIAFLTPASALAVAPDECEQQRAQYPATWNDVRHDATPFVCHSHYAGPLQITLGEDDGAGRRLMSVVTGNGSGASATVYRIWLDREQSTRLLEGRYFATVLRTETSCWIRGSVSSENGKEDPVFFIDNPADLSPDRTKGAGSFYNKAPRLTVFEGNAYECERAR